MQESALFPGMEALLKQDWDEAYKKFAEASINETKSELIRYAKLGEFTSLVGSNKLQGALETAKSYSTTFPQEPKVPH